MNFLWNAGKRTAAVCVRRNHKIGPRTEGELEVERSLLMPLSALGVIYYAQNWGDQRAPWHLLGRPVPQ